MNFTRANLTDLGLALNAKIQAGRGDVPLHITRIVLGAGTSGNPTSQTDVIDPLSFFVPIIRQSDSNGMAEIQIQITNVGNPDLAIPPLIAAQTFQQIGFIAVDPDEGEILYRISQFDSPAIIPAVSDFPFTVAPIYIFSTANAETVSIQVDPAGLVTVRMLDGTAQDARTALSQVNRLYAGRDLEAAFASEIAAAPFNGNVWAWIQNRIRTSDFTGLLVGDYINFKVTMTIDGITESIDVCAEIAGINTYSGSGDVAIGNHIDFISRDSSLYFMHSYNLVAFNNGTPASPAPWTASNMYAWLNSLSMQVPSTVSAPPSMVTVDYTTSGLWTGLPAQLQEVIVPKRALLPWRFDHGQLLSDDNWWEWADIGRLWLPSEIEVCGTTVWGSNGYGTGGAVQYPLFANGMGSRIKSRDTVRTTWWLLTVGGGNSSDGCAVMHSGEVTYGSVDGGRGVPVCFRIA